MQIYTTIVMNNFKLVFRILEKIKVMKLSNRYFKLCRNLRRKLLNLNEKSIV